MALIEQQKHIAAGRTATHCTSCWGVCAPVWPEFCIHQPGGRRAPCIWRLARVRHETGGLACAPQPITCLPVGCNKARRTTAAFYRSAR